jgi:hypothetical protein
MRMTLVIDLPPGVEARLNSQAAKNGVDAASYALRLIDASLAPGGTDEWETRLRAFVSSLPQRAAPLPDDAVRRTAFYADDDR